MLEEFETYKIKIKEEKVKQKKLNILESLIREIEIDEKKLLIKKERFNEIAKNLEKGGEKK